MKILEFFLWIWSFASFVIVSRVDDGSTIDVAMKKVFGAVGIYSTPQGPIENSEMLLVSILVFPFLAKLMLLIADILDAILWRNYWKQFGDIFVGKWLNYQKGITGAISLEGSFYFL